MGTASGYYDELDAAKRNVARLEKEVQELRESLEKLVVENAKLRKQLNKQPILFHNGQGVVFEVNQRRWYVVLIYGALYVLSPRPWVTLESGKVNVNGGEFFVVTVADTCDNVPRMDIQQVADLNAALTEAEAMEE